MEDEGYLKTRSPEREFVVIANTATIRNKRYRKGDTVMLTEDAAKVMLSRNAIRKVEPPLVDDAEDDND